MFKFIIILVVHQFLKFKLWGKVKIYFIQIIILYEIKTDCPIVYSFIDFENSDIPVLRFRDLNIIVEI